MNRSVRTFLLTCAYLCSLGAAFIVVSGCNRPSSANIELRRQNQELRDQLESVERRREADLATIRSLESSRGTLETLSQDRIERLFTTHGIRFGRLTGGARLNRDASADDALKVYVVPLDAARDEIKAAGSFVVEAFDLAEPDRPLIGRWTFDVEEAKKHWYGDALLYEYVLPCPLERPPAHEELTVRVTFTDELTQRRFEAQRVVRITTRPREGGPTTVPATPNSLSRDGE